MVDTVRVISAMIAIQILYHHVAQNHNDHPMEYGIWKQSSIIPSYNEYINDVHTSLAQTYITHILMQLSCQEISMIWYGIYLIL